MERPTGTGGDLPRLTARVVETSKKTQRGSPDAKRCEQDSCGKLLDYCGSIDKTSPDFEVLSVVPWDLQAFQLLWQLSTRTFYPRVMPRKDDNARTVDGS